MRFAKHRSHTEAEVPFWDRYPSGVLHTQIVVDGMIEFLLAAQVAFGRLNRCVAEQELHLLQLSTSQMAQPGACPTQVVRGQVLDASALRRGFHNMPYRFRCEPVAPKLAHAVHPTENGAAVDFGSRGPVVKRSLDPRRDRDRADMFSLADQICDDAVFLPNLEVLQLEADQLGPPQAASDQNRQDRPVSFTSEVVRQRMPQQGLGFADAQPVPNPNAQPLRAFHATDAGRRAGAE